MKTKKANRKSVVLLLMSLAVVFTASATYSGERLRHTIDLNGTWDFEQTEKAFVPGRFTRKIPVPGLIHLAEPKVDQYDTFFAKPKTVVYNSENNLLESRHKPYYNWYRRRFFVPEDLKDTHAVLTILKSKYVTNAIVNGIDVGTSIACYTPVEFPVTHALMFGADNEVLVRVGDRVWLPSSAAGSTDKEKVNYLPGIWDDVSISFTGPFRIHRALMLPFVKEKKVSAKLLVRSFYPSQATYGAMMEDFCQVKVTIFEEKSGRPAGSAVEQEVKVKRDNLTEIAVDIPISKAHLWTPDDPFLYAAEISLLKKDGISDKIKVRFGMRDFGRKGKYFTLNGKKILLRGTNITLHRFFEDPECEALPWDRAWVKKLLSDIPKKLNWNAMRICVGIAPKLWYDIADEAGLLLQNEWLYWQNHGWDEQIRAEYTDWVWSDGSHPSIVIWDAINENWDPYIGNVLIPELKKLDSTRIWDAGYMTFEHMGLDEMDEPHPYRVYGMRGNFDEHYTKHPYPLGDLHDWAPEHRGVLESSAAQLVNEYGWMWLWRDGRPAKLMEKTFPFYLGKDSTTKERRSLQAYWEQLQTEWLRTERSLAGVLCFCYLTNNYGYTGDWFIGSIKDLQPGPALHWFAHCFAPSAVFIDLVDERYTKHLSPREPGSELVFNLVGVNDYDYTVDGKVVVKLLNADGRQVRRSFAKVSIPAYGKQYVPTKIQLPEESGGYLLLAEYTPSGHTNQSPVLSRRYIKVGRTDKYDYFEYEPKSLED